MDPPRPQVSKAMCFVLGGFKRNNYLSPLIPTDINVNMYSLQTVLYTFFKACETKVS